MICCVLLEVTLFVITFFVHLLFLQQVADKFINSTRVCSYELRDENVKKVNCFESHVFNPFSYDGVRGVQTFIQQEL